MEVFFMSKTLVAYFSASGVTKAMAEKLAKTLGADLFEITADPPYSEADVNWKNPLARCNKEWFGKKKVPCGGGVDNMGEYDRVLIGFPIWYGCAPVVVNSFTEQYDFTGKKVGLFASSISSKIGKTLEKLQPHVKGAVIADAVRFPQDASGEEMAQWAEKL